MYAAIYCCFDRSLRVTIPALHAPCNAFPSTAITYSQNTTNYHRQSAKGPHHSDGLVAGGGRGVEGRGAGGGGLAKSRYSRRLGFFSAVDCTSEKQLFVIQYIKMPCSTSNRRKKRLA
jgi:hypothetical protein